MSAVSFSTYLHPNFNSGGRKDILMNLKIELKHRVLWSEDVLAFLTTAVGVLKNGDSFR